MDAKLRVTTRAELKRLHARLRTTTIYVTHDQEEAMTLGDRIVVMSNGLIQQADTPLTTYNRPKNRFVAGFIGMPPMNFFDGTVERVGGRLCFREGRLVGATIAGADKVKDGEDVDGPVVRVGGRLTMPDGGFAIPLPARMADALAPHAGEHLVLGVRPEHFSLRRDKVDGEAAEVGVTLNVVEPLGSDMDLYMDTPHTPHVVARVEARQDLAMGGAATVYADVDAVHVFEPGEFGVNLGLADAAPAQRREVA